MAKTSTLIQKDVSVRGPSSVSEMATHNTGDGGMQSDCYGETRM